MRRLRLNTNQLGFARIFDPHVFSHFTHTGVFAGNLIATLTLAMLVAISIALVAATIIVPLRPTVREAGWKLVVGGSSLDTTCCRVSLRAIAPNWAPAILMNLGIVRTS